MPYSTQMHFNIFKICIIIFACNMNSGFILFIKLLRSQVEEIRDELEVMNGKDITNTRDNKWTL